MTIEKAARERVAVFLPGAIDALLESYDAFVAAGKAADTVAFAKHQMACKTAIAHLNLLLELAGWADKKSNEIKPLFLLEKAMADANTNRLKMVPEPLDDFEDDPKDPS